jgi:hypothetical protein
MQSVPININAVSSNLAHGEVCLIQQINGDLFVLCVMFCRSLFFVLLFVFWALCYLSYFELWILITPCYLQAPGENHRPWASNWYALSDAATSRVHPFCNLQSRARTHAVLPIGDIQIVVFCFVICLLGIVLSILLRIMDSDYPLLSSSSSNTQ